MGVLSVDRKPPEQTDGAAPAGGETVHVLSDINLRVPQGSFTLLIGPSGCGKTTLLRALRPDLADLGGAVHRGRFGGSGNRRRRTRPGRPTESKLADPAMVATLARFLQASLKGWQYAGAHQEEAVKIVLSNDAAGAQTASHQKRMMGEVAKLLGPDPKRMGFLEPVAYERTVSELMSSGGDPVITKTPEGAWSHAVFDAMPR